MYIKTPQGKRCPFPDGLVVTQAPVEVPDSLFLRRRLKDGSVMLTTKTASLKQIKTANKNGTEKNGTEKNETNKKQTEKNQPEKSPSGEN